ncbi:RVT_3 domain-containing protein, partial [Cephalotus follicularis]
AGTVIVIISLKNQIAHFAFTLEFSCSNNQAEYEALIIGLELFVELKVRTIKIIGDSQLVLNQFTMEYQCLNSGLINYNRLTLTLLDCFDKVKIEFTPRINNFEANALPKWHQDS